MPVVGRACLILAFALCLFGVGAAIYAAVKRDRAWADAARRCAYALAGVLTLAMGLLEAAFLRDDFSLSVVASHSSSTTPIGYKAAAMWSSQEGSLLLWAFLLSLGTAAVLFLTRNRLRDVTPYATAVLLGIGAFFCGLLLFAAPPFAQLAQVPSDGAGLNPLLRHPSMLIHPVLLYAGYTLFTVPFAFAAGALLARRMDLEWIRSTRRFSLAAWTFLGAGILLGARWSYAELGWGGYWAWDPVENASLLPWLTGTAFLHSVMVQERRGMLKVWNVSLVLATGILALLGTFLVRSGILDSIHAFGASTVGGPFLVLIAVLSLGSVVLVATRRDLLRSEHKLDSLRSREAVFLANNLVLVGMAVVVFWGTFFPLISEALSGDEASVGPPWFDRYTVPLALALVLLSGIGPAIAWRKAGRENARRNLLPPALGALGLAVVLVPFGVWDRPLAALMFAFATFVLVSIGLELVRGVRVRRALSDDSIPAAVRSLVRRNRRRWGGYTIHVGIALLFVGVAASSAFQASLDTELRPGQTARVGDYDITYVRPTGRVADDPNGTGALMVLGAVLDVRRDGEQVARLEPARGYYPASGADPERPVSGLIEGEPTSEVALKAGPLRDVWTAVQPDLGRLRGAIREGDRVVAPTGRSELGFVALGAIARNYATTPRPANFRFITSPMVAWIWLGGIVVIGGALLALWPAADPARRRAEARARARVAVESRA